VTAGLRRSSGKLGFDRQREPPRKPAKPRRSAGDELRRSLLSAVSHARLRRWPLQRSRCPACAPKMSPSAEDSADWLATMRNSSTSDRMVVNLLDLRALAAGVVKPDLHRCIWRKRRSATMVSIGKAANGFYRSAIDRVKVDVGDAVVMADPGCWKRVLQTDSTTRCV